MSKTKEQWIDEAIRNYKARRYEQALSACECALQLDVTFARALHGKGLILTQQKKYLEALEAYHKACQLAPQSAKIYFDIAELFYIKKNYEESYKSYKMAIQLDRRYEQIYKKKLQQLVDKAFNLRRKKLKDEAITAFQQVIDFNPHNKFARGALIQLQDEQLFSNLRSLSAIQDQQTNNEKPRYIAKTHPFNCRCKDCFNY